MAMTCEYYACFAALTLTIVKVDPAFYLAPLDDNQTVTAGYNPPVLKENANPIANNLPAPTAMAYYPGNVICTMTLCDWLTAVFSQQGRPGGRLRYSNRHQGGARRVRSNLRGRC